MPLSVIGKIYDSTKYYIISGLYSYGTNQLKKGTYFMMASFITAQENQQQQHFQTFLF